MLGLRAETDQFANSNATRGKSYKFASRLHGRFFVSGVTGSFKKYTKFVKEFEDKKSHLHVVAERRKELSSYNIIVEKKHKKELQDDAKKLIELEEKLNEIQRVKELKRQRDRKRRAKRLEYVSAVIIQRQFRSYRRRIRTKSVAIITKFLKVIEIKQSIQVTAWAVKVLKRFIRKAEWAWLQRRQVQFVAMQSWFLVQEVASIWTVARRATADEFVYHCITVAYNNVFKNIMNSKNNRSSKVNKKHKKSPASSVGPYYQFFLTEFDGSDHNNIMEDDDSNSDTDTPLSKKSHKSYHNISPQKNKNSEKLLLSEEQMEKQKRIALLHKKRIDAIEKEAERRKQLVEQQILSKEVELSQQRKKVQQDIIQKENAKKNYLKKLEEEQLIKAKLTQRVREEKLKMKSMKDLEIKNEANECKMMYKEDILLIKKAQIRLDLINKRLHEKQRLLREKEEEKKKFLAQKRKEADALIHHEKINGSSQAQSHVKGESNDNNKPKRPTSGSIIVRKKSFSNQANDEQQLNNNNNNNSNNN
eukprot:gene13656-18328_t